MNRFEGDKCDMITGDLSELHKKYIDRQAKLMPAVKDKGGKKSASRPPKYGIKRDPISRRVFKTTEKWLTTQHDDFFDLICIAVKLGAIDEAQLASAIKLAESYLILKSQALPHEDMIKELNAYAKNPEAAAATREALIAITNLAD